MKVVEQVMSAKSRAKQDELMAQQLKNEEEQLEEASKIYKEAFENLAKMGRGATMKSAQRLLLEWYEPLVNALNKECDEIHSGIHLPDRRVYGPFIVQVPVEAMAIMTLTTALNSVLRSANMGVKLTDVALEIAALVEAETHVLSMKKNKEIPHWQKRAANNKPTSSRELSAFTKRLRKMAPIVEKDWPQDVKVKIGAFLISKLLETAKHGDNSESFIYTNNFHQNGSTGFAKRQGFIRMDPSKYKEFDSLSVKDTELLMPRYLPMLVPPQKWNNRDGTGAYCTMKAPLMKVTSSLQSSAVRRAKMDCVLESLDFLGQIGWRINPLILNVVEDCLQQKVSVAALPATDNMQLPDESECMRSVREILENMFKVRDRCEYLLFKDKNDLAEVKRNVELFQYNGAMKEKSEAAIKKLESSIKTREASLRKISKRIEELKQLDPDELQLDERLFKYKINRVNQNNGELHSLRCDLAIKLKIADKFKSDTLYFPHNIDFRGRAYPIPPNLSHLGNDLCRGIVLFDKAKPLGRDGLKWLKVHLANLCGFNKVSMDDRVAWTDEHLDLIRDSVNQPLDGRRWWIDQESPFQVLAAGAEIIAAIDSGDPENYMCRLPVHQDGSCNGLQHYAGLGRDEQGGSAVNLVPHEKPQDVYSTVLVKVLRKIEEDCLTSEGTMNGRCARLVNGLVSRKVIKQTVMTSVYGVTAIGARAQVQARLQEVMGLDAATTTPDKEQEIMQAAGYLANLTLHSLAEMFESAREIMDWLSSCATLVASQGNAMAWITPLGLPVIQPYRKLAKHTVNTVMQSITLASYSDMLPISIQKQKAAFPPNFVHSMDATHMMMTSLKMKDLGLNFAAVHDSYWTHPSDIPVMNDCLRDAFVELYSLPLLEDLLQSLQVRFPDVNFPPVPARGTLDIKRVKESNYFFH